MHNDLKPEDVRTIRLKFKLDQSQFATVLGLSGAAAVSNIETGFRRPGKTVCLMLRLLDSLEKREALRLIDKIFTQEKSHSAKTGA